MTETRLVSLDDKKKGGHAKFFSSTDPALVAQFITAEQKAGRGVFDILNPLKPGATHHGKDNIGALQYVYFDIDTKDLNETSHIINERLATLPLQPTRLTNSGHGRHLVFELKEAVPVEDPDYERLCHAQEQLIPYLCADPSVRPWSLLRRPGTLNLKDDAAVTCSNVREGTVIDQSEFLAFAELVEDASPLFAVKFRRESPPTAPGNFTIADGIPVDAEAQLSGMKFQDAVHGVNATHCKVIPSLLWRGIHPNEVVEQVVDQTMRMAQQCGLAWDRDVEFRTVRARCHSALQNLLLKGYDYTTGVIPTWLTPDFHQPWVDALGSGKRPDIGLNRYGFYVRAWTVDEQPRTTGPTEPKTGPTTGPKTGQKAKDDTGTAPKKWPTPYSGRDVAHIPVRAFISGQHYLLGAVTVTAAAGGVGKSTLTLTEAIGHAIGRDLLLNEPLEKRRRVWVWNAEDDVDEMERRLAGICSHYNIPRADLNGWLFLDSGYDTPLDLANGNGKGIVHDALIDTIAARVKERGIEVVCLDPLVALHTMPEGDNSGLAKLLRALGNRLAKPCQCAVEITHHTRKGMQGQDNAMTADDMRGASTIAYSARSGRMLHPMNLTEAAKYMIDAEDRFSYYRLERVKANMAKRGTICWVRMVEVPIANRLGGAYGDVVTVPTVWVPPDAMDGITAPILAAICAELGKGDYKRDTRAGDGWAGRLIAVRLNLDLATKGGKAKAKAILDALIRTGKLVVEIRHDKNRNAKEFVVPASVSRAAS